MMQNAVVIGSSGALGQAFVTKLCDIPDVSTVHAFSRSRTQFSSPKVRSGYLDFNDEASIQKAADLASQKQNIDIVIIATGSLHQKSFQPEKSLKEISKEKFDYFFAQNTIGPALVMKHFLPEFSRNKRSVLAVLSARVGSISDNRLGGWYSYRYSKAALNMTLKNAAIEMSRRYPQSIIVGLHPGTVDSPLSKPFQANVPKEQLFSPGFSVAKMLNVLGELKPSDTGKYFDYQGIEINP